MHHSSWDKTLTTCLVIRHRAIRLPNFGAIESWPFFALNTLVGAVLFQIEDELSVSRSSANEAERHLGKRSLESGV